MDCQKEFVGNEYQAHTKCISEEEKYNGPDWKAPSSRNKGERKQTAWVETVNSVLENKRNEMSPKQVALLNAITKHDNVPRKGAKFMNFVRNITKNSFDQYTIEAVWALLEAEWKRQAEANKPQTNGKANGEAKENGTTNGDKNEENGTAKENGEEDDGENKSKKKSKKNKRKMEENGEEEVEVKKKKKKGKAEESLEESQQENVETEEADSTTEFRWGEIIEQVLSARDDKSIALKKLKKKVFSEYYARVGDSKGVKTKEDLSALLNKKLKKKKFKVVGDIVKLAIVAAE